MGHFLIMLLPIIIMPLAGMTLAHYGRVFGVPRYPYSPSRLAASLGCYVGLALAVAFWGTPGIHFIWGFSALALFATSLEGNLRLAELRLSLLPSRWPLGVAGLAIAATMAWPQPRVSGLVVWALAASLLQACSIYVLASGGRIESPAVRMLVFGYATGMAAALAAPVLVAFNLGGWPVDLELVLITLSALMMGIGSITYVLEKTARQLASTRDRIAAEVEERTAELQAANLQLRQLDRVKDQFLSTVSHELRTPLTSIRGYGEFLEDELGGPLSEESREYVQAIMEAAEAMGHKVDDLLDLASLSARTFRYEFASFAYDELLAKVETMLRPILLRRRQRLELSYPRGLSLLGDRRRLQQVLLNLVQNASKFSPEGSVVTVRALPLANGVLTEVIDQGIGIAEDQRERIFQAFYQVDGNNTRTHGGVGMGLAIARSLAEAHGGTLTVESELGRGACFQLRLPYRPPHLAAEAALEPCEGQRQA